MLGSPSLCLVPKKFKGKYKGKKIPKKSTRKEKKSKIKNTLKFDKLFLFVISNSFYLFSLIYIKIK